MSTIEQAGSAAASEPMTGAVRPAPPTGFWSGPTGRRVLDAVSAFARFFMAYTWISAGIPKVNDHMAIAQAIMAYEIFTPQWSDYLARLIGPLEIAGGVLLLLGIFLRQAGKVATVVLVLFILGIGQAWARGLGIDCGCFSVEANQDKQVMDYFITILRDIGYIILSLWTVYRPFKKFALYP